jgi:outer membrane biosynthesis protein TonB
LIREDGTVDQVQIYSPLLPQMDEAARLAFSRWKFKPAMSAGRPVGVEVLVGIPTTAPAVRTLN